jgi:hypothetical protein
MRELFVGLWLWPLVLVIARLLWKAAASEALEDIGVTPPSRWWRGELWRTLETIDGNRALLPKGGTTLYRTGVVVLASWILWVVALLLFLLLVGFPLRHA